jgi:hypothetical protein
MVFDGRIYLGCSPGFYHFTAACYYLLKGEDNYRCAYTNIAQLKFIFQGKVDV